MTTETTLIRQDINARSGSPITSLTSDQVEGNLFAAGFGDGALRLYDQREKPQNALVRVWKEHKAWLTNVHLQRGGQRELVTASRDGYVKLWDLRWDRSIRTLQVAPPPTTGSGGATGLAGLAVGTHSTVAHPTASAAPPREGLRVLAVHEHAPVLAVGTEGRAVRIFRTSGVPLSSFEPSVARFIGAASGVSCVAFHPHRMIVAAAAVGDSHVNLFACGKKGEKEV
jgi:regulatory associated protein of mTOR